MVSKIVEILTKPYDEIFINYEIEEAYRKSKLPKPKILVFDTIPVCKLAYTLLISYLDCHSVDLIEQHKPINISNFYNEISKDYKFALLDISKKIEKHYDCIENALSSLPEIRTQLLGNQESNDKIWNAIIKSKLSCSAESYIKHIFTGGILFGIFLKDYCILCKNPKKIVERNPEELHSTEGYAIEFNDGNGIYFVNNIYFEPTLYSKLFIKKDITCKEIFKIDNDEKFKIATQSFGYLLKEFNPRTILRLWNITRLRIVLEYYDPDKFIKEVTGKEIMKINNVEVRAMLIQFFGYDNLIKELNAKLIDTKDEISNLDNIPITNELWEFEMNVENRGLRKFRFIKVEDYSTHKKVCLGVPINKQTNTVFGAIAWTFGMIEEEYKPKIQT